MDIKKISQAVDALLSEITDASDLSDSAQSCAEDAESAANEAAGAADRAQDAVNSVHDGLSELSELLVDAKVKDANEAIAPVDPFGGLARDEYMLVVKRLRQYVAIRQTLGATGQCTAKLVAKMEKHLDKNPAPAKV